MSEVQAKLRTIKKEFLLLEKTSQDATQMTKPLIDSLKKEVEDLQKRVKEVQVPHNGGSDRANCKKLEKEAEQCKASLEECKRKLDDTQERSKSAASTTNARWELSRKNIDREMEVIRRGVSVNGCLLCPFF